MHLSCASSVGRPLAINCRTSEDLQSSLLGSIIASMKTPKRR